MKKGTKILMVVLAVVIGFAGFFFYLLFGTSEKSTSDIAYYQALSGETDGYRTLPIMGQRLEIECEYDLPLLSELEPYEDCRFNYTARRISIFESHAYVLIVRYDADTYLQRKVELEKDWSYMEEKLPGEFSADEHFPAFEMDGFRFRAVDEIPYAYPKEMLFVGTADENRQVAYIYFHDMDLDYVSPTVAEFLRDETGWNEVVK